MKTPCTLLIILSFIFNTIGSLPLSHSQEITLPTPGVMVGLSPQINLPVLKGVTLHPENPFKFDFILDKGDSTHKNLSSFKQESSKLVKYFLAALTTPENDLWVNLSPYEKNRIIPDSFGQTAMGRDLLAEDYLLKQITASLIYPEGETGKKFWKHVYLEAAKRYGTTNIPINTFNKVWIVPDHAKVYEHGNTAYVVKANLKVMLEKDYLSLQKHSVALPSHYDTSSIGANIVREIIIPVLTKEVNEGQNFGTLRQAYYSLILAVWFKKRMKESLLGLEYVDQNKIINLSSLNALVGDPQQIYQRYLKAFKKGVFNYIKDSVSPFGVTDAALGQSVSRKYFSGGWIGKFKPAQMSVSEVLTKDEKQSLPGDAAQITVDLDSVENTNPNKATQTNKLDNLDRLIEMAKVFKIVMGNRPKKRVTKGISLYDPYKDGHFSDHDKPISSVRVISEFGRVSSGSRKVLSWGEGFGTVMLHADQHRRDILVSTGYLVCCVLAIRARDTRTGRIDIGLAHVYPEIEGYGLEQLIDMEQSELKKDGYEILELVISYETGEIPNKHLREKTYSQYQRVVKKKFPYIEISFISRTPQEDLSEDIAVDQNGVAILKDGKLKLIDWKSKLVESAPASKAMTVEEAIFQLNYWAKDWYVKEVDPFDPKHNQILRINFESTLYIGKHQEFSFSDSFYNRRDDSSLHLSERVLNVGIPLLQRMPYSSRAFDGLVDFVEKRLSAYFSDGRQKLQLEEFIVGLHHQIDWLNSHQEGVNMVLMDELKERVKRGIGFGKEFVKGMSVGILTEIKKSLSSGHKITFVDHVETLYRIKNVRISVAYIQGKNNLQERARYHVLADKTPPENPNITMVNQKERPELYKLIKKNIFPLMNNDLFIKDYEFEIERGVRKTFNQRIEYSKESDEFTVFHAPIESAPDIMVHLGYLWMKIFDRSLNMKARKEALAQYEWWFFQANPYGRSGSAIGDAMSFIGQIALGIKIRTFNPGQDDDEAYRNFEKIRQDYQVLSKSLEHYVTDRTEEFKSETFDFLERKPLAHQGSSVVEKGQKDQAKKMIKELNLWAKPETFSRQKDKTFGDGQEDFHIVFQTSLAKNFVFDYQYDMDEKRMVYRVGIPVNGNHALNQAAFNRLCNEIKGEIGKHILADQQDKFGEFLIKLQVKIDELSHEESAAGTPPGNTAMMHAISSTGPGGIDLTSKRMNLEVDSDKAQIAQSIDLNSPDRIEIKGLYIKYIELKPLKDLPQLLGVSTS